MPEVYVSMYRLMKAGYYKEAFEIQKKTTTIILDQLLAPGAFFSTAKKVIEARSGVYMGEARMPIANIEADDPLLPGVVRAIEDHVAYALDVMENTLNK